MPEGARPDKRRNVWPVLSLVWVAFALRLHRIWIQELRGDEAFGYFLSLQPITGILRITLAGEPHPVGSYLLQKGWLALAGSTELALRFPSVACGVLSVVMLYTLVRALGASERTARLGSLTMALSPYAVWHSQDARMYTMLTAATLGSTVLYLLLLNRPTISRWMAYVALSYTAIHLHYAAIFVLGVQWATTWGYVRAHCAVGRRPAGLLAFLLAQVLIGLAYAPWVWAVYPALRAYGGTGDAPPVAEMIWRSLSALLVGETLPRFERQAFALVGGTLALLGARQVWKRIPRWKASLLLLYALVPLGGIWLLSLARPLFNERYLMVGAPPFYALIGAGLWEVPASLSPPRLWAFFRQHLSAILALLLSLMTGWGIAISLYHYFYHPDYDKISGWRDLAQLIQTWTSDVPASRLRVVQNYPDPTLWYYYQGEGMALPPSFRDAVGARREVEKLVAAGVTWVVLVEQDAPDWDPAGDAARALAAEYAAVVTLPVHGWRVTLYARPDAQAWQESHVKFVNGVLLEGVQVQPGRSISPGAPIVVHTRWQVPAPHALPPLKLFVHVAPAADLRPVAQCDPAFPAGQERVELACAIFLPNTLSDGTYRLLLGLYDPNQPNMPRIPTENGDEVVKAGDLLVKAQSP